MDLTELTVNLRRLNMKFIKNSWIVIFLMLMCLIIFSCGEKKEGKVIVTESKFVIRQDSEKAYVIDAIGKVKNVGEVDVKNVVVNGNCKS